MGLIGVGGRVDLGVVSSRLAMPPAVSVIIPCFNTGAYLAEAVASAVGQDYPGVEVIVVDDGSTDDTPRVVESLRGVVSVRQENQGVSAARNAGLVRSRGEYVVFLDADDRLLPGAIRLGVEELERRAGCGFVYGYSRTIDREGRVIDARANPPVVERAGYATLLAGEGLVPPAVAVFRRAAAESVGGFDRSRRLTQDHDFYLRVAQRWPIHCHERVVAEYRWHDGNACGQSPSRTLRAVLSVIDGQRGYVRAHPEFEAAAREGRRHWVGIFGPMLVGEAIRWARRREARRAMRAAITALRYYPRGFLEAITRRLAGKPGRSDQMATLRA